MKSVLTILQMVFLIFLTTGCVDQSEKMIPPTGIDKNKMLQNNSNVDVLYAPEATFYRRQYDKNSKIDKILSQRNTINPFLAYQWKIRVSKKRFDYKLYFSGGYEYSPAWNNTLQLSELYWAYYYPGKDWSYWKNTNQKSFFTSISFTHGRQTDEYGDTRKLAIANPEFSIEAAKEVELMKKDGFHGVFLDWWHSDHPGHNVNEKVIFTKNRKKIISDIHKKVGDDFLIMGNVNWKTNLMYKHLNAVFLELYKPKNRAYTFNEIAKLERGILKLGEELRYPKVIAVEPWKVTQGQNEIDRLSNVNKRFARLFTAMATILVEHGFILYTDNNNDDSQNDDHGHYYYEFYSVDLGKPISKNTKISKGVAYKKFEKGFIAFNRTNDDVVVSFDDFRVKIPSMDAVYLNFDGSSAI
jgi:hypothetical protein